jgi:hypothetical protein
MGIIQHWLGRFLPLDVLAAIGPWINRSRVSVGGFGRDLSHPGTDICDPSALGTQGQRCHTPYGRYLTVSDQARLLRTGPDDELPSEYSSQVIAGLDNDP